MPLPFVVYGTVVMDRLRRIPRLPHPGEYIEFTDEQFFLGGEAANTAVALAKWGGRVELLGNRLGDFTESEWIRRQLHAKGLRTDRCEPGPGPAPVCDIYTTPDGERTMFGRSWPSEPALWPELPEAWFTTEPNRGPAARQAVNEAESRGWHIYLLDFVLPEDPVPAGCVWQSSTDWVGERGNAELNRDWVKRHAAEYDCLTILTDGAHGLHLAQGERVASVPAYWAHTWVDATGCGDAFRAGMLWGLAQRWGLPECVTFASAVGCLNGRVLGANEGLPSLDEVEALIQEQGTLADYVFRKS